MKKSLIYSACASASALIPAITYAHPGHLDEHDFGLGAGLIHPFSGLDHLTMFIGAGIMLGLCRKKPLTALTLTLGLTAGIVIGSFMHASAVIEYSVAFTLLALACMLFLRKLGKFAVYVLPLMAVVHGLAHGTEIPAGAALGFTLGSALSATVLVFSGYFVAKLLANHKWFKTTAAVGILGVFGALMGAS